ncbi:hypothetical protein J7T55_004228 [Diaporthe amygdali]|uniref:uncharacterized protein n=1 Tax=Phomopsis amygdali TaxID=1214568 RepID=UPI0022FE61FB|nr:uncharacterized protein J7T55_004228 [Diaporthe amygdali]KAJ0103903.1 hypothetical protein J7T55_004228 [Diaporthe amygdali]
MFSLGLVTGTMTILRVLVYRENIDDWILQLDIFAGLKWSVIEVTTAYVISCMPATRFLFVQLLPRFQRLPAVQQARPHLAWMSWPTKWTRKGQSSNGTSRASDVNTARIAARQERHLEMGNFSLKDGTTEASTKFCGSMDYSIGSSEGTVRKHGST